MNKSFLKRIGLILTAALFITAAAPMAIPFNGNAQEEILTGKTALDITAMMGKGFNIGNTLDATGGSYTNIIGHETSWGNPVINQELMHAIKEVGFDSVRIPTTWEKHIDKANGYEINPDFMARVKEVVDMAYAEGLFVILNVQHENWVNRADIDTAYVEIGQQLSAVWAQIAEEFADYDQHLIFEGMNEPRAKDTDYEWTGTGDCYDAVVYLDKLFVETVRKNGKGYNNERVLMIPGYAASSDKKVLSSIIIPEINGAPDPNVAVSVHCYSPYNFCLSDNQSTFDPSKDSDTSEIRTLMANLKSLFLNNGIAVVMGECGCTNTNDNNDARLAWFKYIGEITSDYGIPALVWDNGANGKSGGECHKYIMRSTGEILSQDLIDAFTGNDHTPLADRTIDFESIQNENGTTVIVPGAIGFTSDTLYVQFKKNHTEGVAMGFSLKVESKEKDFTASLDISKYSGTPVKITAWVCADSADRISVGIMNSSSMTEMAQMDVTEEWTKVSFIVTPEEGKNYLYFKGNEQTFYVDDINISLDTSMDDSQSGTDTDPSLDNTSESDITEDTTSVDNNDISGASDVSGDEKNKSLPTSAMVAIIAAIVTAVAAALVIVGLKKKKKD